jgi:hypothetical protein
MKSLKRRLICMSFIIALICVFGVLQGAVDARVETQHPSTVYIIPPQDAPESPHDVTLLATQSLSINITLNATQIVRGSILGINVTITDNETPVRVSNITMFYTQGNVEHNLTDFQELEKGTYFTTLNTTSLNRGWWKVNVQVEKGGTTESEETRFAVVVELKKREYPSPIFLSFIITTTVIVVSAIIFAARNLSPIKHENNDHW